MTPDARTRIAEQLRTAARNLSTASLDPNPLVSLMAEAASLLSAVEGEQAKPINAIAAAHIKRFKACEVVPTAPCCERDGKQHPQYDALAPRHWCDSCLAATYADRLLSQLVASKAPSVPSQDEEIGRD